jgi:hypothetical protein
MRVVRYLWESEMVITFEATEASLVNAWDTVTTGVYSKNEYICFQRHEEHGHEDDDGIYIEYNDQIHAGENVVSKVVLNRKFLKIFLSSPLVNLKDVTEFNVDLNITEAEFNQLADGLKFTFWDCMECLEIVEPFLGHT